MQTHTIRNTLLVLALSGCASDRDWTWQIDSNKPAVNVQLPRGTAAISLVKCYRTVIFQDQHCSFAIGTPFGPVVEQSRIRADIDSFLLQLPESRLWPTSPGRDESKKELPLVEMPQAPYRLFLVSLNPMVVLAATHSATSADSAACSRSSPCLTYPGRVKAVIHLAGTIQDSAQIKWFSPEFPEHGMVSLPEGETVHAIRLPGLQGRLKQVSGGWVFVREE
jgi:hypothetical protein